MPRRPYHDRAAYAKRVLACMVGALVGVILLIRFWPLPSPEDLGDRVFTTAPQETITIEEIQQTKQENKPPPPPPPLPPVPVPNDIELPDDPLSLAEVNLPILEPEFGDGAEEGDAETTAAPPTVETGPKAVRFVQPTYTDEARRRGVRAEVVVQVLVDERGRVQEASVSERYRLDGEQRRTPVDELGYGLEEAALAAAREVLYRPGRKNGTPVQTYTTLAFKFGV